MIRITEIRVSGVWFCFHVGFGFRYVGFKDGLAAVNHVANMTTCCLFGNGNFANYDCAKNLRVLRARPLFGSFAVFCG
jgi:hypothetical protein